MNVLTYLKSLKNVQTDIPVDLFDVGTGKTYGGETLLDAISLATEKNKLKTAMVIDATINEESIYIEFLMQMENYNEDVKKEIKKKLANANVHIGSDKELD